VVATVLLFSCYGFLDTISTNGLKKPEQKVGVSLKSLKIDDC